mgnify:CR=1 FL=1
MNVHMRSQLSKPIGYSVVSTFKKGKDMILLYKNFPNSAWINLLSLTLLFIPMSCSTDSQMTGTIDETDTVIELRDTLASLGAISGIIYLSNGGDMNNVKIETRGIFRKIKPDSSGYFIFDSLSVRKYYFKISSDKNSYLPMTVEADVKPDSVVFLDTLRLQYTNIPTPQNLTGTYDSLNNTVYLTWSSSNLDRILGFKVYRRNSPVVSGMEIISDPIVTDTFYIDDKCMRNNTYGYSISAVDSLHNEGLFSNYIQVSTGAYCCPDPD